MIRPSPEVTLFSAFCAPEDKEDEVMPRDRDGGDEPLEAFASGGTTKAERYSEVIAAARALVEYLDDDGMCRVCGETLDECQEECEARVLRVRLDALRCTPKDEP